MKKKEFYHVCSVSHADIKQAFNDNGIRKWNKIIPKLDDAEMTYIANKMSDYICDGSGYWDACRSAFENYHIQDHLKMRKVIR